MASPASQDAARELEKILSSKAFVNSPQLCRLLRYIVEQEIAGRGDQLKEYLLGVEVFRKGESFDPRVDGVVRTEARRLRQKLAEYYQTEGRSDPIEITLPKGSYRAVFQARAEKTPALPVPPSKKTEIWMVAVAAAVIAAAGLATWWTWAKLASKPRVPSIAVIPLENLSSDPEQEYFSDGVTDALFTELAKIHGLSVISRTSAMQYKRGKKTAPQIARELGVDYLVEGTVTRDGDRVRVSAQLIEAHADRHIWAESFERTGNDILDLQGNLAQSIAGQIHVHVTPQERERLTVRPVSQEARDLYVKGRVNWLTRDTARMEKALEYFQEAIQREPSYALAYAGLADSYNVLGYRLGRKDYQKQSCDAANKALELDDNLGEAHASMDGCLDLWDWQGRQHHLRRAVELSPSYATAHQWLGALLIDIGQPQPGLTEMRRAVELDPLGPAPNNALCMSLYMTRHYDEAIQQALQMIEVFPDYVELHYSLGFAYIGKGSYPEAVARLEKAMTLTGNAPPAAVLLAYAHLKQGDSTSAKRLLEEYKRQPGIPPIMMAGLYAGLGDRDHAFEYLGRSVDERSFAADWINVNPLLDGLHGDARWSQLVRRMNLPN